MMSRVEIIDVEALVEQEVPVPDDKIQTLQAMLGVSASRCADLLRAADMSVERAINHHFDQQSQLSQPRPPASTPRSSSSSSTSRPAVNAASSSRRSSSVSLTPFSAARRRSTSVKKTPIRAPATAGKKRARNDEEEEEDEEDKLIQARSSSSSSAAAAAAASSSSSSSSFATPVKRARRSCVSATLEKMAKKKRKKDKKRAKKRNSMPKGKKKKKIDREDDDEEDDSDDDDDSDESESSAGGWIEDSSSEEFDDEEDGDEDDDDDGARGFRNVFFRRAPAIRPAAVMRAPRRAPAAARAGARGRRGAPGRGRRGLQAVQRENTGIIMKGHEDVDDDDEHRLEQVQTLDAPPPPVDPLALGIIFPDRHGLRERQRWRVGTIVDVDLEEDARGWSRAKIVNIVVAPRTHALMYDIQFMDRADVYPGAIFRFSAIDVTHIQAPDELSNVPRFEARQDEDMRHEALKSKTTGGSAKKSKAGGKANGKDASPSFLQRDFHVRQLVDVRIGSRWFLGQVSGSRFCQLPGSEYSQVLDVNLLDFHRDCSRRFPTSALSTFLRPVAYSHPITHYPLAALPPTRDHEFEVATVYARQAEGYDWASEAKPGANDEDPVKDDSEDEMLATVAENQPSPEPGAASSSSTAPSSSAAAAASRNGISSSRGVGRAAAAFSSSSSSAAASSSSSSSSPAAALPIPAAFTTPTRPLGRFNIQVVSDMDWDRLDRQTPMSSLTARRFLERALPIAWDDPLCCIKDKDGQRLKEERHLDRLKNTILFLDNLSYMTVELDVNLQQMGLDPKSGSNVRAYFDRGSVARRSAAQDKLEQNYRAQLKSQIDIDVERPYNSAFCQRIAQLHGRARALEQARKRVADRSARTGQRVLNEDKAVYDIIAREEAEKEKKRAQAESKRAQAEAKCKKEMDEWDRKYRADQPSVFESHSPPSLSSSDSPAKSNGFISAAAAAAVSLAHSHSSPAKKVHGIAPDGRLRWYHIVVRFNIHRTYALNPRQTTEQQKPLNDLLLLLFPHHQRLQQLTSEATAPLPPYLPDTLSLDGLLKCSAMYHHEAAEKEAEDEAKEDGKEAVAELDDGEERKEYSYAASSSAAAASSSAAVAAASSSSAAAAAASSVARRDPSDPMHMSSVALSEASGLVPSVVLKDYQVQTVRWLLQRESAEENVSRSFWAELRMEDGTLLQYSPFLQRFTFSPHPDVKGGFVCEEMGLGKTIEMLALLNLKAESDRAAAQREIDAAMADGHEDEREVASSRRASRNGNGNGNGHGAFPAVRDKHGCYISRATLIISPVSLISQWIAELRDKSARPLKILSYHGVRPKDPRQLLDYDVVITAYSILSTESGGVWMKSKEAAVKTPWAFEGPAGLSYTSPLGRVHWRRIVLDEGHSVKNASSECSQLASKLLAPCRYLMSGTPFGNSLLDLRGQLKFLGATGLCGQFVYTELTRFMMSQSRYKDLESKRRACPSDVESTQHRVWEWVRRFRNIFTHLVCHTMMRHEKNSTFRGRSTLLKLPDARVDVVRVELTPTQRAAYKLLYDFACKRFQAFKASGDAVRKTIEVLQLLVPLRQACSVDEVDVDAVKAQLRQIARGIHLNGPVLGGLSLASDSFPQATVPAFGTAADECSICLDVLEEALQTYCRHLFCRECIVALCESQGNAATCPNCRAPVSPERLFAPLVPETPEQKAQREAKEAEERELKAEAEQKAKRDADGDVEMEAEAEANGNGNGNDAAAASSNGVKVKKERNDKSDDEEGEVEVSGKIMFDSKLQALLAELKSMKENDPTAKALVFTNFRNSMDAIQKALTAEGIKFQTLLGHYTLSQRRKALDSFRTDPNTTVFLLSVRAAAAGLTLTSANFVFIVEPGFNPSITLQAISRVWRMGQQKEVNVRYLVCSDTVEETILTIAREKMSKRGAADEAEKDGSSLALLPVLKGVKTEAAANGEDADDNAAAASPSNRQRQRYLANRSAGRGSTTGHAVSDATPDLRLHELERLFAV